MVLCLWVSTVGVEVAASSTARVQSATLGRGQIGSTLWDTSVHASTSAGDPGVPCLTTGITVPVSGNLGFGTEAVNCRRISKRHMLWSGIYGVDTDEEHGIVGVAGFSLGVSRVRIIFKNGLIDERPLRTFRGRRSHRVGVKPFRYRSFAFEECPTQIEGIDKAGIIVNRRTFLACRETDAHEKP